MTFSNVIILGEPLIVFEACSDTNYIRMDWTDDHFCFVRSSKDD